MSKRKANPEDKDASKTKMDVDGEDDDGSGSDVILIEHFDIQEWMLTRRPDRLTPQRGF